MPGVVPENWPYFAELPLCFPFLFCPGKQEIAFFVQRSVLMRIGFFYIDFDFETGVVFEYPNFSYNL